MLSFIVIYGSNVVVVFIHEYRHYYLQKIWYSVTDFLLDLVKNYLAGMINLDRWKICWIPLGSYQIFGDECIFTSKSENY